MWRDLLLVALGGAVGSVMRYVLALAANGAGAAAGHYPWGTLLANLIGCVLMGALLSRGQQLSAAQGLLLGTGFCGGLTTFSSLEAEAWLLGPVWHGAAYLALSVSLGMLAFGLGWQLGRPR